MPWYSNTCYSCFPIDSYHNRCRRYTVALLLDEMDTRSKEIKATIPLLTQTTTLASPHSCSLGTWLGYHCKSLYSPSRTRHNLCASQNVALPLGSILDTHVARSRSFRTEDISPCHWPNGQYYALPHGIASPFQRDDSMVLRMYSEVTCALSLFIVVLPLTLILEGLPNMF
jgi:hypothetical protein